MTPDGQQAHDDRNDERQPVSAVHQEKNRDGQRQRDGTTDRGNGNIAACGEEHEPHPETEKEGRREKSHHHARGTGDSFPPLESQPDRKTVAQQHAETRQGSRCRGGHDAGICSPKSRQNDRNQPLEKIAAEHRVTPAFAQNAKGIRRPDVAAALLAEIDTADPAGKESEGYGTEQIGTEGYDEPRVGRRKHPWISSAVVAGTSKKGITSAETQRPGEAERLKKKM